MIHHNWYFVTSKFADFTALQYQGVAKKHYCIHKQVNMCVPVTWSDWCPQSCWYEGKKSCVW